MEAARAARRERWQARISRVSGFLNILGIGWLAPLMRIAAGERAQPQLKELWRSLGIPLVAILLFLAAWGVLAPKVKTSLGVLPGPVQVWQQTENLWADHLAARAKERAFYARQEKRNAQILAENPKAEVRIRPYTGAPTYLDQILTSLETVFTGFIFATLVAVPLGILSRPVADGEHGDQSVGADLQAGVAAGVAAAGDHGGERALCLERSAVSQILPDFGDHGDFVLAVADLDQHCARRGLDRQGPHQCRARAAAALAHQGRQDRAAVVAAASSSPACGCRSASAGWC